MLLLDPRQRPTVTEVLGELSELAAMHEVSLASSIDLMQERRRKRASPSRDPDLAQPMDGGQTIGNQHFAEARSSPHSAQRAANVASAAVSQAEPVFSYLKSGAGNLFRNIRDASAKVVESVHNAAEQPQPQGIDFNYVTGRIAVMSYPNEPDTEPVPRSHNRMEEMQTILDLQYEQHYKVYNVGTKGYRQAKWFGGRFIHRPCAPWRAPQLAHLVELCLNARIWLQQDRANVCVVHCDSGRTVSAVLVASLLCFCGCFDQACPALQLFAARRSNPRLSASQLRYVDYICQLVRQPNPVRPHSRLLRLHRLRFSPVPQCNRLRSGCRPFVEIFENEQLVFSSSRDFNQIKQYAIEDREVELELGGVEVFGDILVVVSHARSSFAGKGRLSSATIFKFQFHSGFMTPDQTMLAFDRSELDSLDSTGSMAGFHARVAEDFKVELHFLCTNQERPRQDSYLVYPWETLPPPCERTVCFLNAAEEADVLEDFGRFNRVPSFRQQTSNDSELLDRHSNNTVPLDASSAASSVEEALPEDSPQHIPTPGPEPNLPEDFLRPGIPDDPSPVPRFKDGEADLLGLFGNGGAPQPTQPTAPPPPSHADDLFGFAQGPAEPDFVFGWGANNPFVQPSAPPPQPQPQQPAPSSTAPPTTDPFADLHSVFSDAIPSRPAPTKPTPQPTSKPTPTPSAQPNPKPTTKPAQNPFQNGGDNSARPRPKPQTGTRPMFGQDAFSDLLGGGFPGAGTNQGPAKSLKDMRREREVASMDPESIKVRDWADGKQRNVRALLCSISGVLWEGVRYDQVGMHELMSMDQVKRAYRNAARAVHPDKWMNTEHENLARLVFVELNDAWSTFEQQQQSGAAM